MILDVRNYTLDYRTRAGPIRVLDAIDLQIAAGEVLGLVGESGSGKTSLASAILRALPNNAIDITGTIEAPARIGIVFQDPATTLNPTLTIGRQLAEILARNRSTQSLQATLAQVELRDPALLRRYPHQASGGEKQRIGIAMAFAARPDLIIFDEPTTALDVITGERILALFRRLRRETGVAALYISHDLALVSRIADRVAVLHRGRLQETQPASQIFTTPTSPYTQALVAAVPRPERRLVHDAPATTRLLSLQDIAVTYDRPGLFRRSTGPAAQNITFDIHHGEILGVVGESGSGKSSLARAITGLVPASGTIRFEDRPLTKLDRTYRRAVQIVFQHPDSSLNPRHRVADILARPLRLFGLPLSRIPDLLEQVRLPKAFAARYPHQLSGGEKQRVAIARAFAAAPSLVVCDEITAPLDVSVQAAIIELLLDLRRLHNTAYLFITHDLNLVRQIAHRLAVMQSGRLVDLLDPADIATAAPYTRALIAATPTPVG